jgi:hypothetical protein
MNVRVPPRPGAMTAELSRGLSIAYERMISLGVYPSVNLATARLLHADARGLLARDIDPRAADHSLSSFRLPASRLPPRVPSSGRGLDAMRVQNRGE